MSCKLIAIFEPQELDIKFEPPQLSASIGSVTIRGIDPTEIATDEEVQEMINRIFN